MLLSEERPFCARCDAEWPRCSITPPLEPDLASLDEMLEFGARYRWTFVLVSPNRYRCLCDVHNHQNPRWQEWIRDPTGAFLDQRKER